MESFAAVIVLFLVLQCFFTYSQCQNFLDPREIDQVEQVIVNNTFYPPLNASQHLKPLVFGLIMSFGGNIDSSGVVSGVRVALDRINNDTSLLPGYSLHYALSDSQVSGSCMYVYTEPYKCMSMMHVTAILETN